MALTDFTALSLSPLDPDEPLRAVEAMADGVSATLRMARGLVEGRRRVDLAGLDRMVGLLCAKALDLPPDQGRQMRLRLAALEQELDGLATALPQV